MTNATPRDLPPIHRLRDEFGEQFSLEEIRRGVEALRRRIERGEAIAIEHLEAEIRRAIAAKPHRLQRVINATGVMLHTNLGRAPLSPRAVKRLHEVAAGYANVEMNLESGKRSSRQANVRELLTRLTGAESATVVNNNAAATVIVLRAVALGREVILSRGELVEIGGSFRIPEIMAVSGAILREVGTTNITRIADYARAITPQTGAILRVHASNFRIRGFTSQPSITELIALCRERNIPFVEDAGSGAMVDFSNWGFDGDPVIPQSVRAGFDLVLFSGDKLLGGPQAGIIVGKREWVEKIEADPLMRAFRLDKLTLAALEATLESYLRDADELPIFAMLNTPLNSLRERAERLRRSLIERDISGIAIKEHEGFLGGGTSPDQPLRSVALILEQWPVAEAEVAKLLRTHTPAVVPRVHRGAVWLDLRTVQAHELGELESAIGDVWRSLSHGNNGT